jgi:hypothetical protein
VLLHLSITHKLIVATIAPACRIRTALTCSCVRCCCTQATALQAIYADKFTRVHSRRYELKLQLDFTTTAAVAAAAATSRDDTQQQTSDSSSDSSSSTLLVLLFPPIGGGLSPTARGWNYEPYPRQAPMVCATTHTDNDDSSHAHLCKHSISIC